MIRTTVIALSALFLGTALLFIGHGLQATLVPLSADSEGYSRFVTSVLWSAYAAGLMVGALIGGRVIARVGHIRAFAALVAGVAATILLYSFAPTPAVWLFLRFMHGLLIAGVFMILESWLNDRATNELRGIVIGIYSSLSLIMISVGQLGLNILPVSDPRLYALAGIMVLLAVVPVALTRTEAPPPTPHVPVDLGRLWQSSRVAVIGSIVAGLTTSAFWGLAPLFARDAGLVPAGISLYLSISVFGGALGMWVLGRMSDFVDRRRVIALASVGAAGSAILIMLVVMLSLPLWPLLLGSFLFGAFALCISSICVAMVGDRSAPSEFVEISGGLLFMFSVGSVLGAMMASLFMDVFGAFALYLFTALAHAVLAVASVGFMLSRPAAPAGDKRDYHPLPITSPEVYVIDPRGDEVGEGISTHGQDIKKTKG